MANGHWRSTLSRILSVVATPLGLDIAFVMLFGVLLLACAFY
ncbi:MAG: hypothetical protein P9C48_00540 [Defluviicoccus sp.]|jgi:hypothetical protein|nr:hypothetical protein [Defluviicoccus sp.]